LPGLFGKAAAERKKMPSRKKLYEPTIKRGAAWYIEWYIEVGGEVRTRGAEQMGLLATAVTVILSLASVVTVLVAALNIAHGFAAMIAERRGELGLLRALGATRRDVRLLLVLEAVAEASATLCAAAAALLDAETENDAVLTTLALTVSELEAETENAPMQTRLALIAAVLVAANVAAPRLTP
jgi:predicted lysophospholipase L1 biosynthesis ABC-type transport system permease subunit